MTLQGVIDPTAPTVNYAAIVPPVAGMSVNAYDVDDAHAIAAQVLVENTFSALVSLNNLTIDGTGNQIGGCAPDLVGILFQNGSGIVNHVAVRNQLLGDVLSGCQAGESIWAQTATGQTSKVTIENSSVHNYNKNGITGNDTGTTLVLIDDVVQGSGLNPVGLAAQNGVQIAYGATGKMTSNTVIDNLYGDPTSYVSADVLLFDTAENSGVAIVSNTFGNSQIPLYVGTDTPGTYGDGVTITGNHIFGSDVFDAIDVCSNGNSVTGNVVSNSAESAIHLDGSCGGTGNSNTATGNTILESACAGILADPGTSGNTTTGDTYYTMPFTITSTTASCTIPLGPARVKAGNKFSPKR
jgi:parallel beta-helix repeat protein